MSLCDGVCCIVCGGSLQRDPVVSYVGGIKHEIEVKDVDTFCVFEIKDTAKMLLYSSGDDVEDKIKAIYYKIPGESLTDGLRELKNDSDFNDMVRCMLDSKNKTVECYVEHWGSINIEEVSAKSILARDIEFDGVKQNGPEKVAGSTDDFFEVPIKRGNYAKGKQPVDEGEEDDDEDEDYEMEFTEIPISCMSDDDDEELVFVRRHVQNFYKFGHEEQEEIKKNAICKIVVEGTSGGGDAGNNESYPKNVMKADRDGLVGNDKDDGYETDYFESDEEGSYASVDTDEEGAQDGAVRTKSRAPVYDQFSKSPVFALGMRFLDADQFKEAIVKYSISNRVDIEYAKNSWKLMRAKCKAPNCQWQITASMSAKAVFRVVKLSHENHTCSKVFQNSRATAVWLAENVFHTYKGIATMKLSDMQQICKDQYRLDVSIPKLKRVRKLVIDKLTGNVYEEYAQLWDYREELLRSNLGSTIILDVDRPAFGKGRPIFEGFYIAFDCCKKGFKKGCRKVIGIDGAFLKGPVKGVILSAIGRDANNQMFPLAWAVVESETTKTWSWFIKLVKADINMKDGDGWTVISDKHLGIKKALNDFLPKAEHRWCARHIFAKWRRTHRGNDLGKLFWDCAKSTNIPDFDQNMLHMKLLSPAAYADLIKHPPEKWCRAYFNTKVKCDIVDNNLCETFNGRIVSARTKCIVSMLEEIRLLVMTRLRVNRDVCSRWKDGLGCRIRRKLNYWREASFDCELMFNGASGYEIVHRCVRYVVDINKKICSCRAWDVSGIPCPHAIKAILSKGDRPADYLSQWFTKATYLDTYSFMMNPIQGQHFWRKTGENPVEPPPIRSMPGRPKKQRIRTDGEPYPHTGKLTKRGSIMTCQNCHQPGHNTRTCKNLPTPKPPKCQRPPKRPKNVVPTIPTAVNTGPLIISPQQLIEQRNERATRIITAGHGGSSSQEPCDAICTQE